MAMELDAIAAWGTGGVSAGAGFFLIRFLFEWIGGRVDKREEAVAAGQKRNDLATQRLIENMQGRMDTMAERIEQVERELVHCREQHSMAQAEVMQLRAMMQGYGAAREDAARIVASDRLEQRGVNDG